MACTDSAELFLLVIFLKQGCSRCLCWLTIYIVHSGNRKCQLLQITPSSSFQ